MFHAAYLSPPLEIVRFGLVGGRSICPFCSNIASVMPLNPEFTSYWVFYKKKKQLEIIKTCLLPRVTNNPS